MSDEPEVAQLTLQIEAGEDSDPEELDQLTRQLRDELQELDLESVELTEAGAAPHGTKSAGAIELGALALQVLPTAIPTLIGFLQSWALRGEGRTVKIKTQVGDRSVEVEYSPKSTSPTQLKELVETLTGALTGKG